MAKKLKIAQVAPLWFPIPPKKYGGIEWIVYSLCEGLTKLGHSKAPGKHIKIFPKSLIESGVSWQDHTYNMMNLSEAFKMADDFDIIHTHVDLWDLYFAPVVKTKVLHTVHNPLYSSNKGDSRLKMFDHFRKNNFALISKSQRKLSWVRFGKSAHTVYNGIRMKEFKFNPKPKNHFIWSARVDKYKGIENVIEIAEKANIKLELAGRLDPSQQDYFNKKIKPHLGKNIKFIGEYSRNEKSDFFGQAKALIYPIEWHEPFGLNMVEAQACGTPVIAFDKGSVPEVVKHGKTGFVVKNIAEAVKAVKKIDQIKREDCRKWVEKNFTQTVMVKNYEKLYYRLLKK
jgi:glycosyltransferase involved in cell wall biosynthesis